MGIVHHMKATFQMHVLIYVYIYIYSISYRDAHVYTKNICYIVDTLYISIMQLIETPGRCIC
jgi:hypothetical protein